MSLDFNKSQDKFIIYRQDGRCGNCGKDLKKATKIHLHHVLNKKDGGAGIVENGVILCGECHIHVHDYNTRKSVLVFRNEFKYANWEKNIEYKGKKQGKEVEFTKRTLNEFDKQGEEMSNQRYESHLRMVEGLKYSLSQLQSKIETIKEKYKKQIDAMESATFMTNYIEPLREKHTQFSEIIEDLNNMIEEHKTQISLHEEILEHLIQDARSY